MDQIRFDFDQAAWQIVQIRKLNESVQDFVSQAQRVRMMMMGLGDGDVVRFLTDDLEKCIRDGRKLCDRLDQLEEALRMTLQNFENVERRIAWRVQGISESSGIIRIGDKMPLLTQFDCNVGETRFTDVFYPDFLSKAADCFFVSDL